MYKTASKIIGNFYASGQERGRQKLQTWMIESIPQI